MSLSKKSSSETLFPESPNPLTPKMSFLTTLSNGPLPDWWPVPDHVKKHVYPSIDDLPSTSEAPLSHSPRASPSPQEPSPEASGNPNSSLSLPVPRPSPVPLSPDIPIVTEPSQSDPESRPASQHADDAGPAASENDEQEVHSSLAPIPIVSEPTQSSLDSSYHPTPTPSDESSRSSADSLLSSSGRSGQEILAAERYNLRPRSAGFTAPSTSPISMTAK